MAVAGANTKARVDFLREVCWLHNPSAGKSVAGLACLEVLCSDRLGAFEIGQC